MYTLINTYINKMTIEDLNNFAIKNNVFLNDDELKFTYHFIKKNWHSILSNYQLFDFDKYKEFYTEENYLKIKKLIKEYTIKYSKYLK